MLHVMSTDAAAPVGPLGLDPAPALATAADSFEPFGPSWTLLREEILRVGASIAEIKAAESIANAGDLDPMSYERLSPRMRRLVDLLTVAGGRLSALICEELAGQATP